MSLHRRLFISGIGAGLASVGLPMRAAASYPTQSVRLVIPFPAGGTTDSIARTVGAELGKTLGQGVVVDNKPGPDGIAAAQAVMQAAPDGHVLLFATATGFSGAPALRKSLPFDPASDFTPVSKLGTYVFFLFVHEQVPASSVAELVAYARTHPGALRCGNGTATARVAAAQLARVAAIDVTPVAYAGDAPLERDVVAGRVDLMFAAAGPFLPHVRSGKLRALATLLPNRSPLLPEVPIMSEAGAAVSVTPWGGLFAPKGVPPAIVERLNQELRAVLARKDVREQLGGLGFEPQASSPEELGAFLVQQLRDWKEAVVHAGIKPE